MINKPIITFVSKKDKSKKNDQEYDFFKYTDFNPERLDKILNKSLTKSKETFNDFINNIGTIKKDGLEYFKNIIKESNNSIEIFLKKFQYVSLYKLNWNVPDVILFQIKDELKNSFYFILFLYISDDFVSPQIFKYLFFIEDFLQDLLPVMLKHISKKTEYSKTLLDEEGDFNIDVISWANSFCDLTKEKGESTKLSNAMLSTDDLEVRSFKHILISDNSFIQTLIKNEVFFDKLLGLIDKNSAVLRTKFELYDKLQSSNNLLKESNSAKEKISQKYELLKATTKSDFWIELKQEKEDYHIQAKKQSGIMNLEFVKGLLEKRDKLRAKKSRKSPTKIIEEYCIEKSFGAKTTILDWFRSHSTLISRIYKKDDLQATQAFSILEINDLEKLYNELPKRMKCYK